MKVLLTVFFALLAPLFFTYAHEHCTHDDIEQNPELIEVEEDMSAFQEEGRVLASYPNIRIYAHYDYLRQTASSSYASYIQNELIPPAIDYFEAALRIKVPLSGKLSVSSSSVCDRSTPSVLKSGVDADFFIYFDSQASSGTEIASTKFCSLASGTKRPLTARSMINRNQLLAANGDVILHEKNMMTMMHELMHGFGFSSSSYPYFIDSNGRTRSGHIKSVKVNGATRTFLDVPPLTEKLRAHYGCSSLQGALMENGGGSGTSSSHFERRALLNEFMTSGSILGRRVSELSLALLEGSGWYVPNYDYADPFFYGKGQGCSFVTGSTSTCGNYEEFCTESGRGCAPTGRGGGSCTTDAVSECKYFKPEEDYDCDNDNAEDYARLPTLQVFGRTAGSKCFSGTLNTRSSGTKTTFCFKYSCSGSGSSTQLQVQVGSHLVTCTDEGTKSIDGYYGSINCPDPLTFCNTVGLKYCPRNCMGRGTCNNGRCSCRSGYSGIDCALRA